MKSRAGFTLLELTVAITLAGIVAILVYDVAAVVSDIDARLLEHERILRSHQAWQTVVDDALRNVRSTSTDGDPTLVLEHSIDAASRPRDRLQFVSAGGTPPLIGDTDWTVTLESQADRVVLTATPVGVVSAPRHAIRTERVTGLAIRVLGGPPDRGWREEWNDRLLPRAVEITYWSEANQASERVLVTLPPGQLP